MPDNSRYLNSLIYSLLIIGVLGLIGVLFYDHFVLNRTLIEEGIPNFSAADWFKSLLLVASVSALLGFCHYKCRLKFINSQKEKSSFNFRKSEFIEASSAIALSLIFIVILIVSPATFSRLSHEDSLIEWASAFFAFAAGFLLLFLLFEKKSRSESRLFQKIILLFFAGVFLLIALEEISWFQRVFNIPRSDFFKGHGQNENNFHNYATNLSENIYYFGSFLFFVMIPFLNFKNYFRDFFKDLKVFLPGKSLIIVGAVGAAYNYDMWNNSIIQLSFWASILILVYLLVNTELNKEKYLIGAAIIITGLSQVIFLFAGANYERVWEITEYKEFFLPLGFFFYAIELRNNFRKK